MIRRSCFLLIFLLLCKSVGFAQSVDHSQNLVDMLMRGDCIRAWNYERQYRDSISKEAALFYRYKMNDLLNRPDSAAICLEQLLDKYPYFMRDDKLSLLDALIGLYEETENYKKAVETYNREEQLIRTGSFNDNKNWKTELLALLDWLREESREKIGSFKMHITKISPRETSIKLMPSPFIMVPITCNGEKLRAIIDTGGEYDLLITGKRPKVASEIKSPSTGSIAFKGTTLNVAEVLTDSIVIGDVLLTNVPALVTHKPYSLLLQDALLARQEKIRCDSLMSSFDAIIGLPLLKKLGNIEIDWEREELCIKTKEEVPLKGEKPNMYILGDILYTEICVNSIPCRGVVDTGAANTFVDLNYKFYESHKDALDVREITKKDLVRRIAVASHLPMYFLQNPQISFNREKVNVGNEEVCITSLNNIFALSIPIHEKGGVGSLFVKRLGDKVRLDFANMRLEAIKRP